MSTPPEPLTSSEQPLTARDARARAKAEKAYRKAQRPWYKKKRFVLAGLLVGFIVIVSAAGGGSNSSDTTVSDGSQPAAPADTSQSSSTDENTQSASEKATPARKEAGFGDKVRDGKFQFVVKGMKCGRKLIGTQDFGQKAQGQFCIVSLTVDNIGDEAQTLSDGDQFLFDAQGRRYSADTEAAIYLKESNTFLEEINPGNTVKGQLVFDVPKSFSAKSLELHDSPFSEGVTIAAS